MATDPAMRWVLLFAMIMVAGYHLARLGRDVTLRRRGDPLLDATHIAMAAAMIMMVGGATAESEARWWAVGLAPSTVCFAARTIRRYVLDGRGGGWPDELRQAVGCGGMLYMLLVGGLLARGVVAEPTMHQMAMVLAPAPRALGIALVGIIAALAVAQLAGLRSPARRRTGGGCPGTRPATPHSGQIFGIGCQLAMSAATVYALALLIV